MVTDVTERPMIFGAVSIPAILSGMKTQTRRPIPWCGPIADDGTQAKIGAPHGQFWRADPSLDRDGLQFWNGDGTLYPRRGLRCPYGKRKDRLWVRETWAPMCNAADPICWCETDEQRAANHWTEYKADTGAVYPGGWPEDTKDDPDRPSWRSPLFLPRDRARILLEITDVRAERLRDISDDDARAEGVTPDEHDVDTGAPTPWGGYFTRVEHDHVGPFIRHWDALNKRRGYGWDTNPWVWVITFRQVTVVKMKVIRL